MCTGRCRKPPYTCSGSDEPDFLTLEQRQEHERAYQRGENSFRHPFEPWVIRSWARHLDEIGGFEIADRVRQNILSSMEIANDPNLTHAQKIKELTKNGACGRLRRNKRKK
jgi:hypothetical protein